MLPSATLGLRVRWDEHRSLRASGEAYSALVRLAEIYNVVEQFEARHPDADTWLRRLDDVCRSLSAEEIESFRLGEGKTVARLERILSVGTRFTFEELLLVLTLRVQLGLVHELMQRLGVAPTAEERLSSLDEDLQHIPGSRENRELFRSAQRSALSHWGLPIRSAWLR